MHDVILTPGEYFGTIFGAAFVFALLGFLVAYFAERAFRAEDELRWMRREN